MTILPAGSFRVSDYRKPIPAAVEREVRKRYELDHDPALTNRAYDTEAGDFIPPQHDPSKIFLKEKPAHDEKTFGRKPGAEKTVTTRGSDVGERARARKIKHSRAVHNFKMAAKVMGETEATKLYPEVARLQRRRKRKIASRGFAKGHRPLRSRNALRRRQ